MADLFCSLEAQCDYKGAKGVCEGTGPRGGQCPAAVKKKPKDN